MRATSGSLTRCGGGGHPPYLSWLWSKFWPQNHVSLKAGINYNSFGPFPEFFFQKSQKNWQKSKTYQKLLKMSENSKFFNFWAISTCNTSKESIFLIEFNFSQKKYDLFEKSVKKSKFSDFFCQNWCWPLVFIDRFLKGDWSLSLHQLTLRYVGIFQEPRNRHFWKN